MEKSDLLLLMTVNPGFGGQRFIPEVRPRIEAATEFITEQGLKPEIEVDGGINSDAAWLVTQHSAAIVVAWDVIFNGKDCRDRAGKLKQSQ